MEEQGLKKKTIKGVVWSAIDNVSSHAVTFIVGIILARLLSPEDYGLIGIIGIFTAICNCFINAGLASALIRKKDATEDDFNTVFICNLVVSIFLYFVLFLCAPYIADFFERQELTSLIRVSSLGLIIGALAMVQRTILTKRIDFKTQTKITIISVITQGVVGISTAFMGWGVWALVAQGLTAGVVSTVLLWYNNKWFPKWSFSITSFRELFGFSSKMLASNLIDTIWKEINQVVIGKLYSPAALGQISRASGFSSLFSRNITGIVQRVSFPVLSEMQNDPNRLKSGYQKIIRSTMIVTFPCMLLLASVSKPMIITLIGEKWLQAAEFLQIICFSSMLYPLHAINLNMLQVQGRSDLFLRLEIIKKAIAVGPILIGIFVSIYWMLIAGIGTSTIAYYLNSYYSGTMINYGMKEQIKDIGPSFIIGLISAIVAFVPELVFESMNWDVSWSQAAIFILVLQLGLGLGSNIFLCEKMKLPEYIELKKTLLSKLKRNA